MKKTPHKKIKRLQELVSTLNFYLNQTKNYSSATIDTLLAQIRSLINDLSSIITRMKLKHILGSAAVLFGFGDSAKAQVFSGPTENPYGLKATTYFALPAAADLDDDGDLDLLVGEYYGQFKYFKNVGTSTNPYFAVPTSNPFNINPSYGYINAPTFADLDDDGDLDLLAGGYYGSLFYYENIGDKSNPNFDDPVENPFGLTASYNFAFPTFVDLDQDGDLDLMVGEYYGTLRYYENTGTKSNPQFAASQANPFDIAPPLGYVNIPSFSDVDEDGDLDMLVGGYEGATYYFKNIGTVTNPSFESPVYNANGVNSTYYLAAPVFADFDGDGDEDLLIGEYYGKFQYYKNNTHLSNLFEITEAQIELYPNPTTNFFSIKGERQPEQVTILNQQGQEIRVFTAAESYDISDLSTGVYFVEYVLDEQTFRTKIIKE